MVLLDALEIEDADATGMLPLPVVKASLTRISQEVLGLTKLQLLAVLSEVRVPGGLFWKRDAFCLFRRGCQALCACSHTQRLLCRPSQLKGQRVETFERLSATRRALFTERKPAGVRRPRVSSLC
jgi:hypothetical protein